MPRLYDAEVTVNYPVQTKNDIPLAIALPASELASNIERFLNRKGNATSFVIVITCVPARHGMGK